MARTLIAKIAVMISLMFVFNTVLIAATYPLPNDHHRKFGHLQLKVVGTQALTGIMKRYDVGYRELKAANPQVDLQNLQLGQKLLIPTLKLLPDVKHRGVVVNLASMRLYYFPDNQASFETYPVGIGKRGQKTPLGHTRIIAKDKNPQWRPTAHVRHNFLKENGYPLPPVVMPGPDNPLGNYKMRLTMQSYLIHGTNRPDEIGTRASAGCIHLFNRDIGKLYPEIRLNTHVNIIYKPFITSWEDNVLYLEAYKPIAKSYKTPDYHQVIKQALHQKHQSIDVDWDKIKQVIHQGSGIPVPVAYIEDVGS